MELLIVGGGLAAQRCIEVLRAAGDDRPVTVVCDEPVRPYDRPPLSKEGLLGTIDRPSGRRTGTPSTASSCGSAPPRALDPARRTVTAGGEPVSLRRAADRHRRPRPDAAPSPPFRAPRCCARFDGERLRAALTGRRSAGRRGRRADRPRGRGRRARARGRGDRDRGRAAAARGDARAARRRVADGAAPRGGRRLRTGVTVAPRPRRRARARRRHPRRGRPRARGVGVAPAADWLAGSGLDPAGVASTPPGAPGCRACTPRATSRGQATGRPPPAAAAPSRARCSAAPTGPPARPRSGATSTACACNASATRAARRARRPGRPRLALLRARPPPRGRTVAVLLAGRPPSALRAARARLDPDITTRRAA